MGINVKGNDREYSQCLNIIYKQAFTFPSLHITFIDLITIWRQLEELI
jgi:hypothetical protein